MGVTNYVNCLKNISVCCMDSSLLFEKHETPVKKLKVMIITQDEHLVMESFCKNCNTHRLQECFP